MQPPSDYVKTLHLKLLYYSEKYNLAIEEFFYFPKLMLSPNFRINF